MFEFDRPSVFFLIAVLGATDVPIAGPDVTPGEGSRSCAMAKWLTISVAAAPSIMDLLISMTSLHYFDFKKTPCLN
jgi:hypothetical protein